MEQTGLPHLEPAGAGLPHLEMIISRYLLFPMACKILPWSKAHIKFQSEADKILQLIESLTSNQLTKQVLVPRLPGIEDSSRFWSVSMCLEHLIIVGSGIANVIVALSDKKSPPGKADTAKVKPAGKLSSAECKQAFGEFVKSYLIKMKTEVADLESNLRYEHPWFGLLDLRQWNTLAAIHQGIHRRQIEVIVKRLPEAKQH